MTSIKLSELLPPKFHDVWRGSVCKDILNIVCSGGRGSGKSSNIAHIITQLLMRQPVNAVGIRKTDNTLEQSVYEQMKWAIEQQGVSHLFKFNKSPLKITYIPRGNYMIFRGAQQPERIKSLKDSRFPFAIAWIEELAEFRTEDEVTTITNSLLRGQLSDDVQYKFFFSYNPPKRKQSWVNKKYGTQFQSDNTRVFHSTYKDNPFIAEEFIKEAEEMLKKNELKYRWEYMGEAIGSGITPFNNLEFRELSDEEVNNFDNIRSANDFGYATDPNAFIRLHYDKKKHGIYIFDEYYKHQLSNRKLAEWLKSKGYEHDIIYADSAEPKSIAELKGDFGISKIKGVKKGKDSVEFGERWLDDLDFICIDPKRCPKTAQEFENIDYETDRDGNPKPRLADKDNHSIDAVRYALSEDMRSNTTKIKTFKGGI